MERFDNRPLLIETGRLTLRPFLDRDLEDCLALICSDKVNKTYMLPDFADREAAVKMFTRLRELSGGRHFIYAICLEDRMIGFLNDVEIVGDVVELGYLIHPGHWNRGYATEALRAVIPVFTSLGFAKVRAGYFEENPASGRVMEKAGMHPVEGTDEIGYRGKTHTCRYYES